jgi:hypothetical protein
MITSRVFDSVRQETEGLVRVYQKLVATSADVVAGQAAGSGQGTVLTSVGIAPSVCEVGHRENQLLVARVYTRELRLRFNINRRSEGAGQR